ncbi:MAG: glycoside hydrolase domain-containing protein [Chitinophagales bacterium]
MKGLAVFIFSMIAGGDLYAQEVPFTSADNNWNADSLGNRRAVVEVSGNGDMARVSIPWRRPDVHPENKRIILQDGKTGEQILNVHTNLISNERGDITFEPVSGKGRYFIYYMPYKNEGRSNYPKGVYPSPVVTAGEGWLKRISKKQPFNAKVTRIESINTFNSFFPMEVIATENETAALVKKGGRNDYLVFPENRLNPIKMKTHLPYRWIRSGPGHAFTDSVSRGENFSGQLGIYALKTLNDVSITFSDLKNAGGNIISQKNISCLNTSGTDYTGNPFVKKVDIAAGQIQALWFETTIPADIQAGLYTGTVKIKATGAVATTVPIRLYIKDSLLADGGISKPWEMTRLGWLNSTMAQANTIIAPYRALSIYEKTIHLLGRNFDINEDGLPKQIQTFFNEQMTGYNSEPNNELVAPIHFHFRTHNGDDLPWRNQGVRFIKQEPGTVQWESSSSNENLKMDITASLEFDGFVSYTIKITALQDISLEDISMDIPFRKEAAEYLMGLGRKGGIRQDSVEWKWDVTHKNQDGLWMGAVNAGLQYSLRDEKYIRPLNTNFYLQKPLLLPASWGNDDKGGIEITQKADTVLAHNYSGAHALKKGDILYYNFNLLITPFHTINTDFQWATRFYHRYNTIDSIKATGATVINIHHATPINPWINYPFIEYKKMKAYIDEAHEKGLKVKIYNTVRELSDRAYELFPMRSLGHEIYSPGKGGGFSWLQEHVVDDYIPAWFVPAIKDAALVNSGMSRWHNYYVEGMNWLVQNVGIDGIYLDDVAFDRITMKRIKRVLIRDGHPGIIDLHSANQFNKNDGFNNSANLYMEHFPYLNRLWFGEYFDYENNDPAFFLTEVSGIPYGLMGEMLQNGGNAWRGMVYGMTNRMPWSDNADPRAIWKVWDSFGMQGTSMIGYWSHHCPVKTSDKNILATVYQKKDSALISLASWAAADTSIRLLIDWNKLGIDPSKAILSAPEISNFQKGGSFQVNDLIPIEKNKGLILIVKEK